MSGVQLNQVKPGFARIGYGLAEVVNNTWDLVQLKRAWHRGINADCVTIFIAQRGTSIRAQGGSGNRCLTARLNAVVRDTTGVPKLDRNTTLFSVNTCGNFLPCGDLFRAVPAFEIQDTHGQQFLAMVAAHFAVGVIDVDDMALAVEAPETVHGGLEDLRGSGFAGQQGGAAA